GVVPLISQYRSVARAWGSSVSSGAAASDATAAPRILVDCARRIRLDWFTILSRPVWGCLSIPKRGYPHQPPLARPLESGGVMLPAAGIEPGDIICVPIHEPAVPFPLAVDLIFDLALGRGIRHIIGHSPLAVVPDGNHPNDVIGIHPNRGA